MTNFNTELYTALSKGLPLDDIIRSELESAMIISCKTSSLSSSIMSVMIPSGITAETHGTEVTLVL